MIVLMIEVQDCAFGDTCQYTMMNSFNAVSVDGCCGTRQIAIVAYGGEILRDIWKPCIGRQCDMFQI